jgi:sugar lactone lactonase YvrE
VTYSLVAGTGKLWVARYSGAIIGYDSSQLASSGAPTPSVISTTGNEQAVVFDRAHNAWKVDFLYRTLSKFTPSQLASSASPDAEVTVGGPSLTSPFGLAFDASNNAWVTNVLDNTLVKLTSAQLASSGVPTANVTISATGDSLNYPGAPAFDRAGNLWVPSQAGANHRLVMFTPSQLSGSGNPIPAVTLTGDWLNAPVGLTFDSANNLWVSNYIGNTVVMYTPAQRAMTASPDPAVILTAEFDSPSCLAFDNGGNLWVVNGSGVLLKFTAAQIATSGSPTATTTITGLGTTRSTLAWCSFSPAPAAVPLFQ